MLRGNELASISHVVSSTRDWRSAPNDRARTPHRLVRARVPAHEEQRRRNTRPKAGRAAQSRAACEGCRPRLLLPRELLRHDILRRLALGNPELALHALHCHGPLFHQPLRVRGDATQLLDLGHLEDEGVRHIGSIQKGIHNLLAGEGAGSALRVRRHLANNSKTG